MPKPIIYIAGPYTHPDPITNIRNAIEVAETIYRSGDFVPYVPHLTMLWHLVSPHALTFWYEYDKHFLRKCDAIYRMPGESLGADMEVKLARELGLPVFYDITQSWKWIKEVNGDDDEK